MVSRNFPHDFCILLTTLFHLHYLAVAGSLVFGDGDLVLGAVSALIRGIEEFLIGLKRMIKELQFSYSLPQSADLLNQNHVFG